MIKFFRRIRQRLLSENKVSKYLLYAIGEIVLVVIGILIALQINNWNEWNKERELETKALKNLAENIELNIHMFDERIKGIQRHTLSGKIILAAIEDRTMITDSLRPHFHDALVNDSNFWFSTSAYEGLRNLGFEVILNEELKKEIIKLYEDTYLNLERSQVWGRRVAPDMDNYITGHFLMDEAGDWFPRNLDEVLSDDYFYGMVNIADKQRGYYYKKYIEANDETRRVLQLIKDELAQAD